MTKRQKNIAAPLYEKAYEKGVIEIPERLKGDKSFKDALKKAVAKINDLDKGKAGYEPHSVRTLHKTKQYMDDEVERLFAKGQNTERRDAIIARKSLVDALNAASPEYEKGTATAQKYFKIGDAAKEGKSFKKKSLEETENILKNMSEPERYAYKQGTLESLLNKAEDRAKNAEFGQFGKDMTNPEVKPLLEKILGKDKLEKLLKDVEVNKNAVENFKEFTTGSGTSKHEANKGILINAIGAYHGSGKSWINLLYNLKNKLNKGSATKNAKTQMKLLLDPKRLLKYESKKVKNKSSGHPAIVGTVVRAREESMK
jgi:hypothetical protein